MLVEYRDHISIDAPSSVDLGDLEDAFGASIERPFQGGAQW
jgi:hypothetical protein